MSLDKTVQQDLVTAMKAKDSVAVAALRSLKSALQMETIEAGSLDQERALSIVKREVKTRDESIETYTLADRADLAAVEEAQRNILQKYLPEQLSEADVKAAIEKIVAEEDSKDFGPLMGKVMAQLGSQADGKVVQAALKEILNG